MRNTGRIIVSLFLIFAGSILHASVIETELIPSRISAGEEATLRIRITGKSADVKPVKFPAVRGLEITFAGSSRNFQFINGKTWSGTVLNFNIYGAKQGVYKIPPFILESDGEQIASKEVTLTVGESASGTGGRTPLHGEVSLTADKVYAGEPFIMRYYIYSRDSEFPEIRGFSEQPHVKGFVMKGLDERIEAADKISAGSFCLVPVETGALQIGGGSVEVTVELDRGFFSMSGRKRVVFPMKEITVIPIPSKGKPDNFAGDVGEFKIEAELPSGDFKVFEEIRIPVKISGRGNLLTLSKPQFSNTEGIKYFAEEKEQSLSVSDGGISGSKNFLVTVIPQKDGNIDTGTLFIEYFNPYKKTYEKAESIPLKFTIQNSGNSGEKGEVQFTRDTQSGIRINYMVIFSVIAVIIIIVTLLVLWERKKLGVIKSGLSETASEEPSVHRIDKTDEILDNIRNSLHDRNSEIFLYNADRGINQIDPSKLNPAELDRYNYFKDKIYSCRYGGGVFDISEMDNLHTWLKKNLR